MPACCGGKASAEIGRRLAGISTDAAASGEDIYPFDISSTGKPVFRAFAEARRKFGGKRVCIFDVDESPRTYDDILRGALALGHALKAGTRRG